MRFVKVSYNELRARAKAKLTQDNMTEEIKEMFIVKEISLECEYICKLLSQLEDTYLHIDYVGNVIDEILVYKSFNEINQYDLPASHKIFFFASKVTVTYQDECRVLKERKESEEDFDLLKELELLDGN